MKPTSNRPAPFLTAMLEGSFSCLIFLATIALVAPDAKAKQYALIGFAAVTIAIAVMLALPSSWVRRKARNASHHVPDNRPALDAYLITPTTTTTKERIYEPEL